jgi:hypothetical protein
MPKKIVIPKSELWDKKNQRFVYTEEHVLVIEHSLVSISKWEAKWHKPFFSKEEKTPEQILDYIKCMTLTQNVNPDVYNYLTQDNIKEINSYLEDPMTATWFNEKKSKGSGNKVVTSELIYYWMVALQIPFECQKWHINRLMTLIRVCNEENRPKKKMSMRDTYSRNAALNAARRAKMGSLG